MEGLKGALLAWKEALGGMGGSPSRPVSRAWRSPGPQAQPHTLAVLVPVLFSFRLSPGVLELYCHESSCLPHGQRDCGWLPADQLLSRRGLQMVLTGLCLAWVAGLFLTLREYLGSLGSSPGRDHPGCCGERWPGPARPLPLLQVCQ